MKRIQEVERNIGKINQQIHQLVEKRENLVQEYADLVKVEGKNVNYQERKVEKLIKTSQKIKEIEQSYWEIDKKLQTGKIDPQEADAKKKELAEEHAKLLKDKPLDWNDFIHQGESKNKERAKHHQHHHLRK